MDAAWYDGGAAAELFCAYEAAWACETVGVASGEVRWETEAEFAGVTCLECDLVCCRHSCCPLASSARPIAP